MKTRRFLATCVLCLAAAAAVAVAQTPAPAQAPFEPQLGQPGKDVVWVPTPQALVDMMLDIAKVTDKDYVIDLGSGDGRTVLTAAKRGARAHGIEYNPDMVELSKKNAAKAGLASKATFEKADLFKSDLSRATVITMFLLPSINVELRPQILALKPGTRIVSNTFPMGDWQPDQTAGINDECENWCTALLWIVPAKVEGAWRLPEGELTLKQQFQMVSGTIRSGSLAIPITDGRLRGDQITFHAGDIEYTGVVKGNTIEGTRSAGTPPAWRATRVGV
jgi:SAM-dependent methyltransferase